MALSRSARRVQEALSALGFSAEVVELEGSTRTAQQAADALGVTVGQIVKSLVFMAGEEPLLVEVSGANRADPAKLERLTGRPVRQARAEEVRRFTGFSIGGVPPLAHARPIRTLIDEDLMRYPVIYAAAGTPFAVFRTTPQDLVKMTQGQVADVSEKGAQ